MLGLIQGRNCFETGRIELYEKEMPCKFEFNYLSTKTTCKFQLKINFRFTVKLSEVMRAFIIKKLKTRY